MASKLFYLPSSGLVNLNGFLAAGASLYFYETGSNTPKTVYTNSTLTDAHPQPITANSLGVFPDIYFSDTEIYRVKAIDARTGETLFDVDPYYPGNAAEATDDLLAAVIEAQQAAGVAASTTNYYENQATGEAATSEGDLFSYPDGDGTIVVAERTSGGSVEVSRTASDARLTRVEEASYVNVLSYLTGLQRTDVTSYTGALDITAAVQEAMDDTWANNKNLYFPAGLYNVTGLTVPGDADNRNRGWSMVGQGLGELFSRGFNNGTIITSATNAPILKTEPDLVPAGVGTFEIAHIRFEQTNAAATAPVIWFKSMYGPCNFHDNSVYQAGTGKGMLVDFSATTTIKCNYIFGPNWPGGGSGAAGSVGLHLRNVTDAGLTTIEKVTSRGFETAFKIGDTDPAYDNQVISTAIRDCESSYCENGIVLTDASRKTNIDNFYCEGGLGGTGVDNDGQYTTIQNSQFFFGFSKAVHHRVDARGAVYSGNLISLGNANTAATDPIGYDIEGSNARVLISGGLIIHDPDSFGAIPNATGIYITGEDPKVDVIGVDFGPAGPWTTSVNSRKVNATEVTGSGVIGQLPSESYFAEYPIYRGALSLAKSATIGTLDGVLDDITGNTLTIRGGSYFRVFSDTPGTTINRINQEAIDVGRILVIEGNDNVTFTQSSYIYLTGQRDFTGTGNYLVLLAQSGTSPTETIWYELARSVPDGVASAEKAATVTDPTGGATVDAEARTAIAAIIDNLQAAGLMN